MYGVLSAKGTPSGAWPFVVNAGVLAGPALEALMDAFSRLNQLALRLDAAGVRGSLEVNPIIVDPHAGRAVAVDALWLAGDNA